MRIKGSTLSTAVLIAVTVFSAACDSETKNNTAGENAGGNDAGHNAQKMQTASPVQKDDSEAFSYLKKLNIGSGDYLFIKYNPKTTTLINKELHKLEKNDPLYDENPMGSIKLIETKLNSTTAYSVVYNPGPSADPTFRFYKKGSDKQAFSISALAVYIPSNGSIYSEGHVNNTFNTRKKFVVENGKFREVEQPYYYVGLETETLKPITLYRTENLKRELASLPADYAIEVVAHNKDTDLYLIKTGFGLLGWVDVKSTYGDLTIEGLRFAGD